MEAEVPECSLDFAFGFDDPNYSDRTLQLEIVKSSFDDFLTATNVLWVKTIHISSLLLAAKSSFFRKLFSNGMQETDQKSVTLQIEISEEESLMNLLKHVYSNDLPTTLNALLDLLVIADKFEVVSCLRDCARALQNLPMTCELTSIYLGLPPSLLISPLVEPLVDATKQFLIAKFKDLDKSKVVEMLNLSLLGIQTILSNDELQVTSEYRVFSFVLAWVRKHYRGLKKRRKILKDDLLHLVRFPFMTVTQLTEVVQTCRYIDPDVASKIVIRALGFKAETPYRKRCLAAEEASRQFVERAYKRQHINVVEHALSYPLCIVYLDFRKEQLTHIFPEGEIQSETFHLGKQEAILVGRCYTPPNSPPDFWLGLKVMGSATRTINYDIQLRMNPSGEFMNWEKGSHTFIEPVRTMYLKHILWTEFINDNSSYFVNNVLHVRVELATKND